MAMVYRASRLAMAASKVQQSSRTAVAAAKPAKVAADKNVVKRSNVEGLLKPVLLSPEMKKFLGVAESPRTQVVKKIWEHIKANNLQNPANKREILCDEKLKIIFGQKKNVTMFEIAKLISPHFIKK